MSRSVGTGIASALLFTVACGIVESNYAGVDASDAAPGRGGTGGSGGRTGSGGRSSAGVRGGGAPSRDASRPSDAEPDGASGGSTGSGGAPRQHDGGASPDGGKLPDASRVPEGGAKHDGATREGGSPGDGGRDFSTDRAKFFGASRCAAAHVQFCEDFESGSLAGYTVYGTPTIDGVKVARGQKALHVTAPSQAMVVVFADKVFPATNNTYYGRLFVNFASLPRPVGTTTYAHWSFIAATGDNVSGEIRVSGQMFNGPNYFGVGTDNQVDPAGTGDWTNSDDDPPGQARAVPLNEWMCIEWMHKGDTNETRFWWDGVEHPSLYTTPTRHGGDQRYPYILPEFRRVWVGFQEYQLVHEEDGGLQQYEAYIDEVALDHERIGCVL